MSNTDNHYKAKVDALGRAMAAVDNADNFITKAMMLEKKTPMGVSDDLKAIGDLADDLYKFIRDYRKAVEVLTSYKK